MQAAYYLALVEVEAIKQAQYMTSLLSMSDIEAVGGLVDGLHTKTLGQISDKDQLRLKELAKFNASSGGGEDHITALQDKLLSDGQNMVHADVLEVIRTAYKDQLRGGKGKASHKAITSQESKGAPNKQNKSTILLDAFHLATEVDTTLSETLFENFTKLPCLYHRVRMQQKNGSNSEEDEDGMDMDGVDSDQDLASIAPIWEIEPVSLTSWIGEEAEAQLKAEQGNIFSFLQSPEFI